MKLSAKKSPATICEYIPGGVNSPVRAFQGLGLPPMMVRSGKGSQLVDIYGNRFVDFCLSWGALPFGHAHPEILSAVEKRLWLGSSFGVTSEVEEELARLVVSMVPSIEQVRFVSSGTEATMSAVRLARGYTGRDKILKFDGNYHGHSDQFLVRAGSGVFRSSQESTSSGIPQEMLSSTYSIPFNDVELVKKTLSQHTFAAVIVEPVAGNMGVVPPVPGFLETLRVETEKQGALLLFDEVITGFRVARGGAQEMYGVTPDLTCLGKIVGGGFPAAAFGGKKEIMECLAPLGTVYQAGTLSGNPVAMEAGIQTLSRLQDHNVYETLLAKTNLLTDSIRQALQETKINACLQQVGSMFTLFLGTKQVRCAADLAALDKEGFANLFRTLYKKGVYLSPSPNESNFVSLAHSQKELISTGKKIASYLTSRSD